MTSFVLDESEKMIADTAGRFFAERAPVGQLRVLRDGRDPRGYDPEVWRGMADMGFCGLLISEAYGGVALGHFSAGLVSYAIGRNLSRTPMLSTAILGAGALRLSSNEFLKASVLPKIASAEWIVTLACDETSRHSTSHCDSRARTEGDGYVLDGRKIFVLDGQAADRLIVVAHVTSTQTASGPIALFIVDPSLAGVTVTPRDVVDNSNIANVTFRDVRLPRTAILSDTENGRAILDRALNAGRACLAAEALGLADEVFDRTLEYLKQREQFGVKIGSFQALQHRAANLYCELQLARSAVLAALRALDEADPQAARAVSLAKAKMGEVGRIVTDEAVHLHGGIGMTDECDIGLFMKRMRVIDTAFGDTAFHLDQFARSAGY